MTTPPLRLVDELDVGTVSVNDHHREWPHLGVRWVKDSGIGSENAREAQLAYMYLQSTIVNIDDELFD